MQCMRLWASAVRRRSTHHCTVVTEPWSQTSHPSIHLSQKQQPHSMLISLRQFTKVHEHYYNVIEMNLRTRLSLSLFTTPPTTTTSANKLHSLLRRSCMYNIFHPIIVCSINPGKLEEIIWLRERERDREMDGWQSVHQPLPHLMYRARLQSKPSVIV